jgi:hypothetical protein
MRLLGRPVELEMTLRTFDPCRLIEYLSVQQRLPDVRHERRFSAVGDGFEYRLAVEFEPRPGLQGAFDRGLVQRAVKRTMHRTVANLEGPPAPRSERRRCACQKLIDQGAQ